MGGFTQLQRKDIWIIATTLSLNLTKINREFNKFMRQKHNDTSIVYWKATPPLLFLNDNVLLNNLL